MIIQKDVAGLIPYANNSRTHSDEQVTQIAASIKEFGFTNPVLIDGDGGIIAGHGRTMAAKKLGMKEVPCIVLDGLSKAQIKAYIIADNKLALNAGWDDNALKREMDAIASDGFNLEIIGFDLDEISKLFDETGGISISDEIEDVKDHAFTVKYPYEKRIEVMNAIAGAISEIVGVTLWCDHEQI